LLGPSAEAGYIGTGTGAGRESMDVDQILRNLLTSRQLEPYIRHIRFPHYKNLQPKSRLDFTYPLTALVGANGTNKSSVLRALYGCPGNNNLGNFWFSTKVDPIEDTGDRPRFIYGYINQHLDRIVEAIKTRIQKKSDPDYWEPSRPLIGDGMEPMPPLHGAHEPGRSKTRWDTITKPVVYMDFRSEISAFDKYFYHGDLIATLRVRTKQDFIRRRSTHLRSVIDQNLTSHLFHGRERLTPPVNRLLSQHELSAVCAILERKYSSIRIIGHELFTLRGVSAILENQSRSYSEAFAGSGEFSIVMLVVKILEAQERSLILLDEPEVSLHPGAQERLVTFLLDQIKKKKHQIVISTHSPMMIRRLPSDAIKPFHLDKTGVVEVLSNALPEEAFFYLGEPLLGKRLVIVEDRLAAELVKSALRPLGEAAFQIFDVRFFPGGADTLYAKYLPVYSNEGRKDIFVLLDGDKRRQNEMPDPNTVPTSENGALGQKILAFTGVEVQFPVDSGGNGGNQTQLIEARRRYMMWVRSHVSFLPGSSPEEFVWENMTQDSISEWVTSGDAKAKFRELTKLELQYSDFESVSADEIFATQKIRLARILDSPAFEQFAIHVQQFLSVGAPAGGQL
jgi:predicted ATPase